MRDRWKKSCGAAVLALLLAGIGAMCAAVSVRASDAAGTTYIIKYKESTAWLMEDASAPFALVDEAEMERLRDAGALEWYEIDGDAELLEGEPEEESAGAPYYESYQWNLALVGAEAAYENDYLGQGVRVGVVDSGINPHPALADKLLPGRSYISGANPSDTADSYGHGTKVAGLIAGAGTHGIIGTAPKAELVPLKVTDGKSVKVSAICLAIYGGIDDYGCGVLNLSLGVTGEFEALREAVAYAASKGVTVVSAAGNAGNTARYYPAAYDSVIGVGSVDQDGNWYARSNHNDSVFLTAPGVEVRSTSASGGYALGTGTSFSAPQVSGAAALLLGVSPSMPPGRVMELLAGAARDRGAAGYDEYYGYGILNIAGLLPALAEESGGKGEQPCTFLPQSGPALQIANHTDAELHCIYFLAAYDGNGRFLGAAQYPLTVPPRGTAEIAPPDEDTGWAQFLCEAETLRPLTEARKSP